MENGKYLPNLNVGLCNYSSPSKCPLPLTVPFGKNVITEGTSYIVPSGPSVK